MKAAATGVRIEPMRTEHAVQVLAIYQLGIDEGNATFETTAPTWEAFDASKLDEHRLVALDEGGGRVLRLTQERRDARTLTGTLGEGAGRLLIETSSGDISLLAD